MVLDMEIFFLKLLLAHLIGDFVLLPSRDGHFLDGKPWRKKWPYLKGIVHGILAWLFLGFDVQFWPVFTLITLLQWLVKPSCVYLYNRWNWKSHWLLLSSQAIHVLLLVIMAKAYFPEQSELVDGIGERAPLLLTTLLLLTSVSSSIVRSVMQQWPIVENGLDGSLPEAGKYIGFLERILVFGFILMQQWQAIGLMIAAKSVFRFGDLSRAKDRKLTEYILIGTLLSIGLGILIGIGYTFLDEWLRHAEGGS